MQKNESGFTLLESLMILSVFLTLTSLFPPMLKSIQSTFSQQSQLELNIFMNQLSHEVKEAISISFQDKKLILIKGNNDTITIEQTNNGLIRRLRNGTGHVPMLSNVKDFKCDIDGSLVECKVELENGYSKIKSMKTMHRLKKGNKV